MRCKGCKHCSVQHKGVFIATSRHFCELGFDLLAKSGEAPITAAWELCRGEYREPKQ